MRGYPSTKTSNIIGSISDEKLNMLFKRIATLIHHLFPPLLLLLGLSIFIQSFFLSRTPFVQRSSCAVGSAGVLLHNALGLNDDEIVYLRKVNLLSDDNNYNNSSNDDDLSGGCWTSRLVDSVIFIVVDALRFDFARDRLPLSIGSRLFPSSSTTLSSSLMKNNSTQSSRRQRGGMSKLVRFVADPPTVTMQRLKGLTTGGLPTFADITGSFGGANVDEDSWIEQIATAPWSHRHRITSSMESSKRSPQIAFVGDDTWIDLFPTQFNDAHPFPSFNTRDLDSVDDGCLVHLPRLLDGLVGMNDHDKNKNNDDNTTTTSFELIVAHFLGVDHVGHTYGPNDPHMEHKLRQMDTALSDILDRIDDSPQESCIVALVLGDHGMTEDGNHGGGTDNEVNAGLFAHYSPGCGSDDDEDESGATTTTKTIRRTKGEELGSHAARVFDTIHQIDLVPTISILLGLPVPYANIGGLVPNLLPSRRTRLHHRLSTTTTTTSSHVATALALNAAQVWNYLYTYSKTSNDLPSRRMRELKEMLDSATLVYRDAISQSRKHNKDEDVKDDQTIFDSTAYRQACGMFKLFLAESTDLGKQVWTQFNEGGMKVGIGIMILAWIMTCPLWRKNVRDELFGTKRFNDVIKKSKHCDAGINIKDNPNASTTSSLNLRYVELTATISFMIFHCMMLTFSNSYIEHEKEIVGFFLSVLCLLLVCRRWVGTMKSSLMYLPIVVAICSRANDIFVTGHGLDPSIRLHAAHHPAVFLSSLMVLAMLRIRWLESSSKKPSVDRRSGITPIPISIVIDIIVIVGLACTWWEKRSHDHSRTGFISARIALVAIIVGSFQSIQSLFSKQKSLESNNLHRGVHHQDSSIIVVEKAQLAIFRALLFLVFVTGPAMASTAMLIVIQCAALRRMTMMETTANKANEISSPTMAAMWRLAIRYFFFATNHQCSFNRLQFSAAFVATNTFQFHLSGVSLFMNTFGCEILGSCLVLVYSQSCYFSSTRRSSSSASAANYNIWQWFIYYQWTEMLTSCISVSLMKRHLMVWAIFAPRFMFAAVFTAVGSPLWVMNAIMGNK